MNTLKATANFILALGLKIQRYDDRDDNNLTDAAIELTDGRHIQIGDTYFMVFGKKTKRNAILGPLVAEINGCNLNDLRVALTR